MGTWARWVSPISGPPSTCSRPRGRRICGRRSPPRRQPISTSAGPITRAAHSSSAGRSPTRSSWRATRSSAKGSRRRSCPSSSACSPRRRRRGRRHSGPNAYRRLPLTAWADLLEPVAKYLGDYLRHPHDGPLWWDINVERRHAEIAVPMYHVTSWYRHLPPRGHRELPGPPALCQDRAGPRGSEAPDRPLGPPVPLHQPDLDGDGRDRLRLSRPRRSARDPAPLVRPVAEGRRHRHPRRAARPDLRDGGQSLAGRAGVAPCPHALYAVLPGRRRASQYRGRRRHPRPCRPRRGSSRPLRLRPRGSVPTRGGNTLILAMGVMDQRPVEARADVLVYTSEVMTCRPRGDGARHGHALRRKHRTRHRFHREARRRAPRRVCAEPGRRHHPRPLSPLEDHPCPPHGR